jgi:hypothetical protein
MDIILELKNLILEKILNLLNYGHNLGTKKPYLRIERT